MKSKLISVLYWIKEHVFLLVSLTVKLVIGKKEAENNPTRCGSEISASMSTLTPRCEDNVKDDNKKGEISDGTND